MRLWVANRESKTECSGCGTPKGMVSTPGGFKAWFWKLNGRERESMIHLGIEFGVSYRKGWCGPDPLFSRASEMDENGIGYRPLSFMAKWMATYAQIQEQFHLSHIRGDDLIHFRWELAFLCMHATLIACCKANHGPGRAARRQALCEAFLSSVHQVLAASEMEQGAVDEIIETWSARYAQYDAAGDVSYE